MNVISITQNINCTSMIVCKDGVLLDDLEKDRTQEYINSALRYIKNITNNEMFAILPNNRFYCCIIHKVVDKFGRKRPCIFIWDKDCDIMMLMKTAKVMGVDYSEINRIKQVFIKKYNMDNIKKITTSALVGAFLGGLWYFKFQKVIFGGLLGGVVGLLYIQLRKRIKN